VAAPIAEWLNCWPSLRRGFKPLSAGLNQGPLNDPWVSAILVDDCATVAEQVGDGDDGFDTRDRILALR
jgi:hypothetical protein